MRKRRLVLHSVTILAIVIFAFLAIGSAAIRPNTVETASVSSSSVISSEGHIYNMPPPEGGVSGKSYVTLGLVFATSVMEYDEKGKEISSQEGIIIMLLKEAQKLGGNDILNLRTDEKVTYDVTRQGNSSSSRKTVTTAGSALAIKYYD